MPPVQPRAPSHHQGRAAVSAETGSIALTGLCAVLLAGGSAQVIAAPLALDADDPLFAEAPARPIPKGAPQSATVPVDTGAGAGGSTLDDDWTFTAAGAQKTLDPHQTFAARNHLITSNPGTFTGADVAAITGATRFYGAGITGQNTASMNIEAGHVWNGHESLDHVSTFLNEGGTFDSDGNPATPEYDRHATWVGAMIGGRNGGTSPGDWQTGIAPATDLQSGAVATAWGGSAYSLGFNLNIASMHASYGPAFGQADVINSSWGGTDAAGSGSIALITDGLQNLNPTTTFVASAGNSGPGANTVGAPGSGYNVITVGALQNDGSNVYDSVAGFSSRGPQDYADPVNGTVSGVRAAVDIAAPGTELTGAFYGGQTGGNNPTLSGSSPVAGADLYSANLGGTSFAAPITAGGAALLHSAREDDPGLAANAVADDGRVVKAVLLNSADKIPGWDNGQSDVGGVVTTTQSLDWDSGAGALDLDRAFDQYLTAGTRDLAGLGGGVVNAVGWDFGEVGLGDMNSYVIDDLLLGGSTLTATLAWFREREYDYLNGTFLDAAQANLDLIVRDIATGAVAESISLFNLVEHLSFVLPYTGRYAIDVLYGANTFDATAGSFDVEQFGLAWWGEVADAPAPGTLLLLLLGGAATLRRRTALQHARAQPNA